MHMLEKIDNTQMGGYLTTRKRIIFQGAVYHITQRAPGKEIIFIEDGDYLYFLKIVKEITLKHCLFLFSFALLPNHVHLLLQITTTNLSLAMKNIFERYAKYFNKKYSRKGHVFCGRYRASLCCDDHYFLSASAYIHLNPYRAGLCSSFKDYRWSSLGLYMSQPKKSFVSCERALSFIDTNLEAARAKYLNILEEIARKEGSAALDPSSVSKIICQGKALIKKLLSANGNLEIDVMDMDKLVSGLKEKGEIKNTKDRKARKYVIEQLLSNGHSAREIMGLFNISKATFYRITATESF